MKNRCRALWLPRLAVLFIMQAMASAVPGQPLRMERVTDAPNVSFRGLSVVDDSVVWLSGPGGWVGKTANGGWDWAFSKVQECEACDFRSLYAFDVRSAVMASAGTPAVVYRTGDGGATWQEVYRCADTAAFFDGIDFRSHGEGVLIGDAVDGRLMILLSHDSGRTWSLLPAYARPEVAAGEASFAASGTTVHYYEPGKIMIATGGKVSRLLSCDNGAVWKPVKVPVLQGSPSQGIFSFAFRDPLHGIVVGGDYKNDTLKQRNVLYTNDGGRSWLAPAHGTGGYRECVTYLSADTVIAVGPGGADVSWNCGLQWHPLFSDKGYHVVKKARKGRLAIMAGLGKVGVLKYGE